MSPSRPPTAAPPMNSAGMASAAAGPGAVSPSSSTITVGCAPTASSSRRMTWAMQHPGRLNTTTGLSLKSRSILLSGASPPSIVSAPPNPSPPRVELAAISIAGDRKENHPPRRADGKGGSMERDGDERSNLYDQKRARKARSYGAEEAVMSGVTC
ncbi:hypothetical protein MUK42_11368 [Musa troglodytarum]|uniref:Uncharacterized protein n=1 Tax=Musa troglodytarum TaxID=320322 RepID=A0A9E7GFY2_9LILI|nr:hypothetical protein MUK42_11368 [Musa troglodytarum]